MYKLTLATCHVKFKNLRASEVEKNSFYYKSTQLLLPKPRGWLQTGIPH